MMFIGDSNGIKAIKSQRSEKKTQNSTTPTQLSNSQTHFSPQFTFKKETISKNNQSLKSSRIPRILQQKPSCKATRVLKVTLDKPWRISQIIKSIGFPLKHIDSSQMSLGVIGIYFFSLNQAIEIYNTFVNLEAVRGLYYLNNLSTFEHCDCTLFNNTFNLTEVNILRFLEMIDKVVLLKKVSPKRYLVKFDSVLIQENIQRVKTEHFWQFDKRYYESLICFSDANYDFVYTSLINPLRLKFCNMETKDKFKNLKTKIDFKAIMDEQDDRTTVMIKNIPNRIQKQDLINLINEEFYGGFDFIYLPIDFQVFKNFFFFGQKHYLKIFRFLTTEKYE